MDERIEKIIQIISQAIKPEKIFLFGSRVNGSAAPDSDIDLLLLCSESENKREVKLRTHRLFDAPKFSMDVFVLTPNEFEEQKNVANTLAREVSKKGLVCYG